MAADDDVKTDLAPAGSKPSSRKLKGKPRVKVPGADAVAVSSPDAVMAEAALSSAETPTEAEPAPLEAAPVEASAADLPAIAPEASVEPGPIPAPFAAKPRTVPTRKRAAVQSALPKPSAAKPSAAKPSVVKPSAMKPSAMKQPAAKPVAVKPVAKPAAKLRPVVKAAAVPARPAAMKSIPAKPLAARPALKPVKVAAKPVPAAAAFTAIPSAAKTAPIIDKTFAGFFNPFTLEDKTMNMGTNFAGFQEAITDAQSKAKAAFEKSTSVLGEVSDFAKGNVEAAIESGKILAEGVQGMGTELVAEGRSAFEAMTADIKELAAVKSPTDFFKIQGDLMRKSFDSAVAYGSKNSEAMLKLFSDAAAPISGRMSLAMEKARSTSL